MGYNKLQALRDNIAAIKVAYDIVSNQRQRTDEEIEVLKKYSGFGGIKEAYEISTYDEMHGASVDSETKFKQHLAKQYNLSESEAFMWLTAFQDLYTAIWIAAGGSTLHWNGKGECNDPAQEKVALRNKETLISSIKASIRTAFYTPTEVVSAVGDAVNHVLNANGIKATSLLETSAGTGGFLSVAAAGCKKVAVEIDPISAMIGYALNPDADWITAGFQEIDKFLKPSEELGVRSEELFDVVASNVPFAQGAHVFDQRWFDEKKNDEVHKLAAENLHTYFFVKGLEQLENGGILAFITSRGVADAPSNEYLRRWLVENGNLLAAVRLPDNLFMDGSGVEVGSDLIIFQRDIHKKFTTQSEEFFMESVTRKVSNGKLSQSEESEIEVGPVNRLLSCRSQAIYTHLKVGKDQFGKMMFHYYWREGMDKLQQTLTERLNQSMDRNFRKSAWLYGHDSLRILLDNAERVRSEELGVRSNQIRQTKAQQGNNSSLHTPHSSLNREQRRALSAEMEQPYNEIHKAYIALVNDERSRHAENQELRRVLNEKYDAFVQKYGTLHKNETLINKFQEYQMMLSLEYRDTDKEYHKADVFSKPVCRIYDENTVLTPMDALNASLNEYGKVVWEYMQQLTKLGDNELYDALRGEVFFLVDPDTKLQTIEHKSECINGDVITKRKRLEYWLDNTSKANDPMRRCVADTIEALRRATPTPIEYKDIEIQLGVRWLPLRFFEQFACHIFNSPSTKIVYVAANDVFKIEQYSGYNSREEGGPNGKWSVRCQASGHHFSGYDVLGYALLDKCPKITYTRYGEEYTDHEGMQLLQKMIDKMRKAFADYMKSSHVTEADRREIAELYNEKFNCYVRGQFDGSMMEFRDLHFENLGFSDLYQSQKDCITMMLRNYGGVAWHTVGGGKTMIMCVTAYEMHRLGLCHKPVIIGLKANVQQIADTFRKAYPHARMLYPGKDDFTQKHRVEFLNKIANNNWDVIIMTHEQFFKIPLTPEVENDIDMEAIEELEAALDVMNNLNHIDKNSKRQMAGLETRKQNLMAKIKERKAKMRKVQDDVPDFRKCQIDFLQIDEYQQFKNLNFTTRHGRVSGLGNSKGSDRAGHLLTCIRDIQQQKGRDMCAAFYSGTIITNALTEMYVLFKYLRPAELKRQGISCFDAWAAVYIHKSHELELSITNQLQEKERFRTYVNVPELTQFLRQITDYRSAEMINLDIPQREDIYDLEDPTPEQEMMLQRLVEFAKHGSWDALGLPEHLRSANLDKSVMLVATGLARKVALDPRLIDQTLFHDHPNNKVHRCAKRLYDYYMEFDEHKGTQFVFTDLSSYNKDKWNVCSEIRRILVEEYHLPAEEIVMINDYHSQSSKAKLFDKLNAGEVRIVFGNTTTLGTGVNAQQRAVAIHHLEAPWRPADLEQRDGRAIRHGNEVKIWGENKVRVVTYGTRKTLDSYRYNLLHIKQLFISSVATNGHISRHIDEDYTSEDDGMNYAELKALLSGNEDLLAVSKLERKVETLEREEQQYTDMHTKAEQAIADDEKRIASLTGNKQKVEEELALVKQNIASTYPSLALPNGEVLGHDTSICVNSISTDLHIQIAQGYDGNKEEVAPALLTINGSKNQTVEELGRALMKVTFDKPKSAICIGKYCGMDIMAFSEGDNVIFAVKTVGNQLRRCNSRGFDNTSHVSRVCYFDGIVGELQGIINTADTGITMAQNDIEAQKMILKQEWDGATELMRLRDELAELTDRIKSELAAEEAKREAELLGQTEEEEKPKSKAELLREKLRRTAQ